jgi:hypothetical protein
VDTVVAIGWRLNLLDRNTSGLKSLPDTDMFCSSFFDIDRCFLGHKGVNGLTVVEKIDAGHQNDGIYVGWHMRQVYRVLPPKVCIDEITLKWDCNARKWAYTFTIL